MYDIVSITERIDLSQYIRISDADTHAYDPLRMFQCILLGYAQDGYFLSQNWRHTAEETTDLFF